jgi:hypothetical protein
VKNSKAGGSYGGGVGGLANGSRIRAMTDRLLSRRLQYTTTCCYPSVGESTGTSPQKSDREGTVLEFPHRSVTPRRVSAYSVERRSSSSVCVTSHSFPLWLARATHYAESHRSLRNAKDQLKQQYFSYYSTIINRKNTQVSGKGTPKRPRKYPSATRFP